jgi:alpha-tubulin suppressor-like RCC1 family protein
MSRKRHMVLGLRPAPMDVRRLVVLVSVLLLSCGSDHNGGAAPGGGAHDGGALYEGSVPEDGGLLDDSAANDEASALGSVSAQLQLAPGVTISHLDWTVSNPALLSADRKGAVDVSASQNIQFVVGGLPPGSGYSIVVSGTTDQGALSCTGTASFSVTANATTSVSLTALCTGGGGDAGDSGSITIGGGTTIAPLCAAITALSASPSDVDVGGAIKLAASGIDANGNAADVVFSWTVTGGPGSGTFSSAAAASPTFTCTSVGSVSVTVAATTPDGGQCMGNSSSVALSCQGKKVASITASPHDHVCALFPGGTAECWGGNAAGQLGNGKTESALTPVAVQNLTAATSIVAGNAHTCALLADGTVQCWGELAKLGTGLAGGLDDCGVPCSMKPVAVSGLAGVKAIAAGSTHTCALLSSGTVECWGDNVSGELGDGTMNSQLAPVPVQEMINATAISAGDSDTCALLAGGTVQCWGYNLSGQLGNGAIGPDNCGGYPCSLKPVTVLGLSGVRAIVSGGSHSCALLSDGAVQCWGFNDVGELGNGTQASSPKPVPVSNLGGTVLSLVSGVYHSCAVLSGGMVACWGDNRYGQFCNGNTMNATTPVAISNLAGATAVSLGNLDTCALMPGSKVVCCGANMQGQLGNGTVNSSPTPVVVGL